MPTAIQATNADGREEEFRILASGQVQHKWQNVAGTWAGSSSMTNLVTDPGSVTLDGSQDLTYNERAVQLLLPAYGLVAPNGVGGWHQWTTAF